MKQRSSVFRKSFSTGLRQWRITAIVYLFQLCLAFTLGMQVFDVLKASIGHSLELNKLLVHYDHTVFTDFLKIHGASITPLIGQLRWLLLTWLIFSVFINGGLLYAAYTPGHVTPGVFWRGAASYFFPFGKISLLFLFMALVWSALIWIPALIFLEPSLEYFSSEKYTIGLVLSLLLIYSIGIVMLFLWSVVSRALHIHTSASMIRCIRDAWKNLWKNRTAFSGLISGFIGLNLLLLAVYWLIEAYTGMTSVPMILLVFVVQQAFVFFRIQMRQMLYAGIVQITIHSNDSSMLQ